MRNAKLTEKPCNKQRCEMDSLDFCVQCSPEIGNVLFFLRKHRKNRCETTRQIHFRCSNVPKLEFQHMPAPKSLHPARRQTHVPPRITTIIPMGSLLYYCISLSLPPKKLMLVRQVGEALFRFQTQSVHSVSSTACPLGACCCRGGQRKA